MRIIKASEAPPPPEPRVKKGEGIRGILMKMDVGDFVPFPPARGKSAGTEMWSISRKSRRVYTIKRNYPFEGEVVCGVWRLPDKTIKVDDTQGDPIDREYRRILNKLGPHAPIEAVNKAWETAVAETNGRHLSR